VADQTYDFPTQKSVCVLSRNRLSVRVATPTALENETGELINTDLAAERGKAVAKGRCKGMEWWLRGP
jgi:hypothetical protein